MGSVVNGWLTEGILSLVTNVTINTSECLAVTSLYKPGVRNSTRQSNHVSHCYKHTCIGAKPPLCRLALPGDGWFAWQAAGPRPQPSLLGERTPAQVKPDSPKSSRNLLMAVFCFLLTLVLSYFVWKRLNTRNTCVILECEILFMILNPLNSPESFTRTWPCCHPCSFLFLFFYNPG